MTILDAVRVKTGYGFFITKIITFAVISSFLFSTLAVLPAEAAIADWSKGVNVVSNGPNDFSSDEFKQSVRDAKALGVNFIGLVIPYYQSNANSTDLQSGWNTPTDATLSSAIEYVRSLGMKVAIKPHVDPYDGTWRAHINPSDRTTWFKKYGDILVHLGEIAETKGAETFILGTELVSMASSRANSGNTVQWNELISRVRAVYRGTLSYGANSTNNNDDQFQNEKKFIGFWAALDYVGLSTYYNLNTSSNDVASLKSQWDYWNNADLKAFAAQVGKPLVMTEIGYRSVTGAHQAPWDWGKGGAADETEQANSYQALFEYWNDFSYMQGVFLWNWSTNPNAGGAGNTDYTPQNKKAQSIISQFFTKSVPPSEPVPGPSHPTFAVTGTPTSAQVGQKVTMKVSVKNDGAAVSGVLSDIEIYDSQNRKVFQKFYENQDIAAKETKLYTFDWTPVSSGTYRLTYGAFQNGWSSNLYWNDAVTMVNVAAGSGGGGSTPPASGGALTDIWWPTDGASVSGAFPLKALLQNKPLSDYRMFWQVDGGALVEMTDSQTDYPHKEAWVDVSSWSWKGKGPYEIKFVSKANDGRVLSEKSTRINIR